MNADTIMTLARQEVARRFSFPVEKITGMGLLGEHTTKQSREIFGTLCNLYNHMVEIDKPCGLQHWMVVSYDGEDANDLYV